MDISDAILRSIIEGNHRFGTIFTRANKIMHMSRETFHNHLRQLVDDKYVVRTDKGKQKIEYKINAEAFNVIQGFQEDEYDKELQSIIQQYLKPEIDFTILSKKMQDEMIQEHDEFLRIFLIKQNLATIVINSLNKDDKTAKKKAEKLRNNYDETIRLIFELILKINPNVGKMYPGFIFHILKKDPKPILNSEIIKQMEDLGKKTKLSKKKNK